MNKELEAYDVIKHLKNYYNRNKEDEKWIIKGNILTTPAMLDYLEVKLLLEHINNLQKKAELGETYKKLYGEIKKQKDSVVSEIKRVLDIWENKPNEIATLDLEEILRMLGEIDE